MGFEQDYECVCRRGWGRPLAGFKRGEDAARVADSVEKRLADDLRQGELPGIEEVAGAFGRALVALAEARELPLGIPGASGPEIVQRFRDSCQNRVGELEHPQVAHLVEVAVEELRRRCDEPAPLESDPGSATRVMVATFLREYAKTNLWPAVPFLCQQQGLAFEDARGRLDRMLGTLRLDRMIDWVLDGHAEKVRAPRTARRKVSSFLEVSILRVR